MKKLFVFAVFFIFTVAAYCEQYSFRANMVDEIDIVISAGTLNIASGKTKNIIIDISPGAAENVRRNIRIGNDKELKIYLNDADITAETVVNITVPASGNDIEINTANAAVNVSGIKGSLNIDTVDGAVNVSNFIGDFEVDTVNAEVNADGIFKELDIETSNADVTVAFRKIPSLYEYSVEGAGKVALRVPSGFAKARLKVDRREFYGTFSIE